MATPARISVLFVAVLAWVAVGAAVQPTAVDPLPAPPPAPVPPPAPPPPLPPPPGPPVLAVKVDNAPQARPPTGLGAADEVYVEPVEAGITRIIGIFASRTPPMVGPVRSARETDLRLLPQFGRPTLAFSGAAPELLPRIDDSGLQVASQARVSSAYRRGPGEPPHNLYVRPDRLPQGQGWSPGNPLVVGAVPDGGRPDGHEQVHFPNASVDFFWSQQDGRWLVSFDGRPYTATDSGRLGAGTVVLQTVSERNSALQDSEGNVTPIAETVGSGHALVLRDGLAFDATWSRPTPESGTTYTTPSGQPLPFAPGQVWTVLVPG